MHIPKMIFVGASARFSGHATARILPVSTTKTVLKEQRFAGVEEVAKKVMGALTEVSKNGFHKRF
jgi:hypothetical protein